MECGTSQGKGNEKMKDGAQEMMVKRFVGKDTRLGKTILTDERYARYRPWIGQVVTVDAQSARYGGGLDIIVNIRNPETNATLAGVRMAVLVKVDPKKDGPDFSIAEQTRLREIAENTKAAQDRIPQASAAATASPPA